jgi:hypothetical protein
MKSGSTDPSRFHFGTLNSGRGSNIKYLPYAFSEHGIIALAGVLRNKVAAQVSIGITKAFVEMRSFLSANRDVFAKIVSIDNKLLEHDRKFDEVFNLLQQPEAVKQCVFYKGQFYDAFKLVIGFIRQAKTSIAIIDSYANGSVLEMLAEKRPGVSAAIITANPGKIPQQHLQRFAAQHGTLQIRANRDFHDRFVIVDGRDVYAFGASLKDLGKRCFGVFKVEDTDAFLSCVEGILTGTEKYS